VNTLAERATPALVVDMMFAALRVQNESLNALAIELFGRFGQKAVRHLVLEAVDRKNPPAFRLRLLRALDRIGAVRDATSIMDLNMLLHDRNPKIRAAAAYLIFPRPIGNQTPKETSKPPA
jgi:hypothetical protein